LAAKRQRGRRTQLELNLDDVKSNISAIFLTGAGTILNFFPVKFTVVLF